MFEPIMDTYWFTVASGDLHERYAADLELSCRRHGIELDVLGRGQSLDREQAKMLKIAGIEQAPPWARRIVFLDADTLLIDPVELLDNMGAMDAPKRAYYRQSGVIVGPPDFMKDLASRWREIWEADRRKNAFKADQVYFSPAYDEVAARYGIGFLPKRCNYLVKRWKLKKPWPAVVHRAGNLSGSSKDAWSDVRDAIRNGRHVDPYGPAPGDKAWSGGRWSFCQPYQLALDFLRPRNVAEWGPGLNTLMALTSGAERITSHEGYSQWAHNYRLDLDTGESRRVTTHVIDEQDDLYINLPDPEAEVFFVDGRRRAECLKTVREQASPWAVAVLHDASRRKYRGDLLKFPYVVYMDRATALASHSPRILRLAGRV